jgi:hypothetical protein
VIETVPENLLGRFAREGGEAVATTSGDEVHLIVEIPMLEAMLVTKRFGRTRRAFSEFAVLAHENEYTDWSL